MRKFAQRSRQRRTATLGAGLMMLSLAACGGGGPDVATDQPLATRDAVEYRLDSGDELRVTVFGEDNLSGEYAVNDTGRVSFPLVGNVNAKGLSVAEFERATEAALRDGFLMDPNVSAEVINFRPFYILGEVKEPGEYPYNSGLTVLNAVATAEGFTYRANTRYVFIKRAGENAERRYLLSPTTPVRPGDTIRIGERFF